MFTFIVRLLLVLFLVTPLALASAKAPFVSYDIALAAGVATAYCYAVALTVPAACDLLFAHRAQSGCKTAFNVLQKSVESSSDGSLVGKSIDVAVFLASLIMLLAAEAYIAAICLVMASAAAALAHGQAEKVVDKLKVSGRFRGASRRGM